MLSKDFVEKLQISRFLFVVSDSESERSRKILQRENDLYQGLEMHQILVKSALSKRFADFGRPCQGLRILTGLRV